MKKIVAIVTILLAALSCHRVKVDCVYTVRVYVQQRQGGEKIPAEDVKVYAFFVDPSDWEVANIDDARRGVITSKSGSGEKRDDPETAVKVLEDENGEMTYRGKNRFEKPFSQQNVMLVVAHGSQKIFAYGNANLQFNLDRMEVTLVLELFRTDTEPYTQGIWEIHNEGTESLVECAYTVTSNQRRMADASASSVPLNTARLRVFYLADDDGPSKEWKAASYSDAVNGILTNIRDASMKRQAAEVDIQYKNNKADVTLTNLKTVLVVYDAAQPMYAYAPAALTDNPAKFGDDVTFLPYKQDSIVPPEEGGRWTVVTEKTVVVTRLTVVPRQKISDMIADNDAAPLLSTKGYAFYVADTTKSNILSYEDALTGKITLKKDGTKRDADIVGIAAKNGMRIGFDMIQDKGHEKVLVVICDTLLPQYAVAVIEPKKTKWPEAMLQTVIFKPYLNNQTVPAYGSDIWEIRNGTTMVK